MRRGREERGREAAPREDVQALDDGIEPPRRALVVDDDDETREYLRDLLALCGFEVEAAADARGARALVARRAPDVMLIDLMMPNESGASFLRDLRAKGVPIPALIVTARSGDGPDACARELDALVVRKPFLASDLLEAVTRAVSRLP